MILSLDIMELSMERGEREVEDCLIKKINKKSSKNQTNQDIYTPLTEDPFNRS